MAHPPSDSSTMDETINRMIGATPQKSDETRFLPSSKWQGPKSGYSFGTTDEHGTGYHLDHLNNGATSSVSASASSRGVKRTRPEEASLRFSKQQKKTPEELLAEAEASVRGKILELSPVGIEKTQRGLKNSIHKNQIQRAEFSSQPESFMETELQLNEDVLGWKAVAASPEVCYPVMVSCGAMGSLTGLMAHENGDIALSVLEVLTELFDVSLIKDGMRAGMSMGGLARDFVKHDGLELIVNNLGRLSESQDEEDLKGMDDTVSVIEALLDLDTMGILREAYQKEAEQHSEETNGGMPLAYQSVASIIIGKTAFLCWLLGQTNKKGPFYAMKLHTAEVLSTLLQQDETKIDLTSLEPYVLHEAFEDSKPKSKNSTKQQKTDGLEMLLQSIAPYRKTDPQTDEECEYLENLFNALSAALLHPPNILHFLEAQGVELMLRCLREKRHSGSGSLDVLSFLLSSKGAESQKACEYFVCEGGFKVLFPLMMMRSAAIPKPSKCCDAGKDHLIRKVKNNMGDLPAAAGIGKHAKRAFMARKEWVSKLERNVIQIIYALTRHLHTNSPKDSMERLLAKFLEADCEKCDRLVELLLKYDQKMRMAEAKYYRSDEADEAEMEGLLDVDLAALHAKLKGGGDLFHRIGAICAFVSVGSKRCHEHLIEQFRAKQSGISVTKAALEEFATVLEDGDQKDQIKRYLTLI